MTAVNAQTEFRNFSQHEDLLDGSSVSSSAYEAIPSDPAIWEFLMQDRFHLSPQSGGAPSC